MFLQQLHARHHSASMVAVELIERVLKVLACSRTPQCASNASTSATMRTDEEGHSSRVARAIVELTDNIIRDAMMAQSSTPETASTCNPSVVCQNRRRVVSINVDDETFSQ